MNPDFKKADSTHLAEAAAFLNIYDLWSAQRNKILQGTEALLKTGAKATGFFAGKLAEWGRSLKGNEQGWISSLGGFFEKADFIRDSMKDADSIKLARDLKADLEAEKTRLLALAPGELETEFAKALDRWINKEGLTPEARARECLLSMAAYFRKDTRLASEEQLLDDLGLAFIKEFEDHLSNQVKNLKNLTETETRFNDLYDALPAALRKTMAKGAGAEKISFGLAADRIKGKSLAVLYDPLPPEETFGYYLVLALTAQAMGKSGPDSAFYPDWLVMGSFFSVFLLPVGGLVLAGLLFVAAEFQVSGSFRDRVITSIVLPLLLEIRISGSRRISSGRSAD